MKRYTILLAGILLSCWSFGQRLQNGQNGSNYTTIDQISPVGEAATGHDKSPDQNALLETYQDEIWVIEFTSDSTFVITEATDDFTDWEGNEIMVPRSMITQALLNGMVEAYRADSSKSSLEMLESRLGKSLHQIAQSRDLDMLLFTEYSFGQKSGSSEYKVLEGMVNTSSFDIMSNEKEFYRQLDNMVSGILVNIVFKPEEEIEQTLQERMQEMQFQQGVINSGMADYLFRQQIGN